MSNAQSYIVDSIIVNFPNKDSLQFQHSFIVEDHRSENPNFLSVNEKKKWLVFPVDQIVIASKPVSEGLMNYQNDSSPRYS